MIIPVFVSVLLLRIGRFQRPPAFGGADAKSAFCARSACVVAAAWRVRFWRKTDVESTFWTQNRCQHGVDASGNTSNEQKNGEQDPKQTGKTSRQHASLRQHRNQHRNQSRMATKEDHLEDFKALQALPLEHPQWGGTPTGTPPNGG